MSSRLKKKFIKPVVTHIPQQSSDDFLVLAREMFKGSDIDAKMMPVGQTNILMPWLMCCGVKDSPKIWVLIKNYIIKLLSLCPLGFFLVVTLYLTLMMDHFTMIIWCVSRSRIYQGILCMSGHPGVIGPIDFYSVLKMYILFSQDF